jgi:glyoxylase-like metal-dependent hydrolase (beta-lactamase superfamily II)
MGPHAIEITSEIHQVGGHGLTAPEDAAIYLITIGGRAALVDAGCGGSTDLLLANVEAAGVAPEAIDLLLLTHCHFDHSGGAHALRARLGCRVVAHALDAAIVRAGDDTVSAADWYGARLAACPIDIEVERARTEIELAGRRIEALHIPGHSPGSLAYVIESDARKVVFGQDVHGPLHPALRSDASDYQRSLHLLRGLDADILCEGHYGIYRGRAAVATFISRFIAH